jgi:hypothetical protein
MLFLGGMALTVGGMMLGDTGLALNDKQLNDWLLNYSTSPH